MKHVTTIIVAAFAVTLASASTFEANAAERGYRSGVAKAKPSRAYVPRGYAGGPRRGYAPRRYAYYGRPDSVGPNGLCQRDTGTPTSQLNFRNRCDTEEFWNRILEGGGRRR